MWRWGWHRDTNTVVLYYDDEYDPEANTAILCEGEVGTEIQTLSYCDMTMSMTQRLTLPSSVVLNMTLRQTPMETCEEMMRGMPMCSKYEWRHNRDKREGNKISRWAFVRISVSVWRAHVQPACFCPHTRPNIFKENKWLIFCIDKNPTFDFCFLFFCCRFLCVCVHTFSAISFRECMIRL